MDGRAPRVGLTAVAVAVTAKTPSRPFVQSGPHFTIERMFLSNIPLHLRQEFTSCLTD